jgi:hypothetical protein
VSVGLRNADHPCGFQHENEAIVAIGNSGVKDSSLCCRLGVLSGGVCLGLGFTGTAWRALLSVGSAECGVCLSLGFTGTAWRSLLSIGSAEWRRVSRPGVHRDRVARSVVGWECWVAALFVCLFVLIVLVHDVGTVDQVGTLKPCPSSKGWVFKALSQIPQLSHCLPVFNGPEGRQLLFPGAPSLRTKRPSIIA